MRKIFRCAGAAMGMLAASPAFADDFWCNTKAVAVGQDSGGAIWLGMDQANGGRFLYVCTMPTEKEKCQGMLSILLAAKGTGKTLNMRVVGNVGATSCSTVPAEWTSSIRPVWLAIID